MTLYVVMMKTRPEEFKVCGTLNQLFCDDIIPLFEIIKDDYVENYAKNPVTGEFAYEIPEGKKRRQKILLEKKTEDVRTLEQLNNLVAGKKAFIDFYRFDSSISSKMNPLYTILPLSLRNITQYKKRLLEISRFHNFIPVVSIKNKSTLKHDEVQSLFYDLRNVGNSFSIAVRIDIRKFDEYKQTLKQLLHAQDYLLLDIGTVRITSLKDQIAEISKSDILGTKILLNSPRKSSPISNADYEEEDYTDLINCDANRTFDALGFQGFGDYGGLKNDFPTKQGPPTKACALALLFDVEKNKYMSFMNPVHLAFKNGHEGAQFRPAGA